MINKVHLSEAVSKQIVLKKINTTTWHYGIYIQCCLPTYHIRCVRIIKLVSVFFYQLFFSIINTALPLIKKRLCHHNSIVLK